MNDDEDSSKLTRAEQEAEFLKYFRQLSPDDQNAFQDVICWIAYDRPKNSPPLTKEEMEKLLLETKRENIRRRLGGKVGQILQFPGRTKPD